MKSIHNRLCFVRLFCSFLQFQWKILSRARQHRQNWPTRKRHANLQSQFVCVQANANLMKRAPQRKMTAIPSLTQYFAAIKSTIRHLLGSQIAKFIPIQRLMLTQVWPMYPCHESIIWYKRHWRMKEFAGCGVCDVQYKYEPTFRVNSSSNHYAIIEPGAFPFIGRGQILYSFSHSLSYSQLLWITYPLSAKLMAW